MKQKVIQLLGVAVALFMSAACSNDDDNKTTAPTDSDHGVEVCIVFSPQNLGDQGYADRVLAGMFLFDKQLTSEDYDRVLLRYMTPSDNETLHNQLRQRQLGTGGRSQHTAHHPDQRTGTWRLQRGLSARQSPDLGARRELQRRGLPENHRRAL